jgi:D-beta-D-heptose 7-phosphate kinase/D-beta-D-heptose 1-phosphate adenosyltransferase
MAAGSDLASAAHLANIAGSIVVAKVGTAPIRAQELLHALESHEGGSANAPKMDRIRQAPLRSWDEAKEEVLRWRARGLKIGFTNGCFDVLHLGHVSYLNQARAKCDRLVVALNSDSSVKILKGPDRPVHDEESRATVIGALGAVDLVVMFGALKAGDDNTACDIIAKLQPDIYFKGGDYRVDQIPEAPSVKKYGGVVEVMPVYEGHSSTQSIQKMKTA